MTWVLSAVSLFVATLTGGLMFRRNARKVDADTTLATTAAAAAAVDMMRGLITEQRLELDFVKLKAESARQDAAEAKMMYQACEARERGLRVDMAVMRARLDALERATPTLEETDE